MNSENIFRNCIFRGLHFWHIALKTVLWHLSISWKRNEDLIPYKAQLNNCVISAFFYENSSIWSFLSTLNEMKEELSKGENIVKWISWLGHLERIGEDKMPKMIFIKEVEGTRWRGRPKKMERSGKRSPSVGSGKMERVGDRQGQMERYCSTGQSPQQAVAPTEEEGGGGGGYNFELKSR